MDYLHAITTDNKLLSCPVWRKEEKSNKRLDKRFSIFDNSNQYLKLFGFHVDFQYQKLKQERKARNLTIKQLSDLSRVSAGMVSSIERGIVNPSVDILFRICNALQQSIDYFLPGREDGRDSLAILRRHEQFLLKNAESKTYFASPLLEKFGHSVLLVTVEPSGEYGRRHIVPESNELIVVIEGQIVLFYENGEYVLEEGDSAYFSAGKNHFVINRSSAKTKLVWCLFKGR